MNRIFREALPEMLGGLMLLILVYLYSQLDKLEPTLKVVTISSILLVLIGIYFLKKSKSINKRVAREIGFLVKKREVQVDLDIYGGLTYWVRNEIKVFREDLHSRSEVLALTGSNNFSELEISISTKSNEHRIEHELITETNQYTKLLLKFSPSLKKGESIDYEILYHTKSALCMNYEQVVNEINNKRWPFTEPYEFAATKIYYPTEWFKISLNFPPGYIFYGKDFWEITLQDDYERIPEIYKRLLKEKAFEKNVDRNGNTVISIKDDNPTVSTKYILKFIPPKKSEYERILADTTNKL